MHILTMKGNTALTFGEALQLVKEGKLVQRTGWNGKGMFIFQRPEDGLEASMVIEKVKSLPQSVKDYYKNIEDRKAQDVLKGSIPSSLPTIIKFTSYLCMKAADNSIVNGWLASQTDMLSSDWVEVGF